MRGHAAAVLAAALALGVPAPAFAQSAGDDQYRDPFAGEEEAPDSGGENTAPAPAPAPSPAPAAPTGSTPVEPVATTAGELPRTGAEEAWIAAAGLLLLAAGTGLRRTART
jgi:LPXTG-motif cell wall-anchored protein